MLFPLHPGSPLSCADAELLADPHPTSEAVGGPQQTKHFLGWEVVLLLVSVLPRKPCLEGYPTTEDLLPPGL